MSSSPEEKVAESAPDSVYATKSGYPLTRSQFYRQNFRLRLIDLLSRYRFIAKKGMRGLGWLEGLFRMSPLRPRLEMIQGVRSLEAFRDSPRPRMIFHGKISRPDNKSLGPLYTIPGLRSQSRWDKSEFPWIETLIESNYSRILEEAKQLRAPRNDTFLMPGWGTHVLFAANLENKAVTSQCPFTADLLRQVPRFCGIHSCISSTRPQGAILRHSGEYNWTLRIQLGLEIPNDRCYLEVADEKIRWEEGKAFVFDDSYVHAVVNPTDQVRRVLFFDIYHPDLSDRDIEALEELHRDPADYEILVGMSE